MKLLQKLLLILPYIFVFIFSLYVPIDPDLGWHLKNGEYFFQHGSILRDNPYTTLMPDYQWANTSWFTDVISYGVYAYGGFLGLTILSALVVTLTFFFFSKAAKLQLWDQVFLFPLILYLLQPLNLVSFRGQQISLLFAGILFYILSLYTKSPRTIYWIIPLFFLWANLHGEFILGLALLGLWIGLFGLQQIFYNVKEHHPARAKKSTFLAKLQYIPKALKVNRKKFMQLIAVFLASTIATLINPFGWDIHIAAISHVGSPLLQSIQEYLPFEMLSMLWWNQVMAGTLLLFGFIVLFFKGKIHDRFPLLGAGVLLFFFSFAVRRYAWPAYYLILPLLVPFSDYLKPDNKKLTQILAAVFAFVLVGIAVVAKYPFTPLTTYSWNAYCDQVRCSPKSVDYLIKNNLTEDVFTLYGWGGWLIWNHPEVKPVIDGRMHLWSENGYSGFEEYYEVEQNRKDIDKTKYNTVLMPMDMPIYGRLIQLENMGKWKMVYSDDRAAIFVRNQK